jgi:hypothetical protein
MTYDSATVENDPFLIQLRFELNELEAEKDCTYKAFQEDTDNIRQRIAYDAALMRWVHKKVAYEAALKAVIGL